jgi:transposase
MVLLAAEGMRNKDIALKLGVGRMQVGRWRDRYAQSRLSGIERDLPRGAPGGLHNLRILASRRGLQQNPRPRLLARRTLSLVQQGFQHLLLFFRQTHSVFDPWHLRRL